MLRALSDLLVNLRAGARLALFTPVDRDAFRIDAAQLFLLALLSALLDNGADWIRADAGAALDWAALGAELASLAVLVVIAALMAWITRDAALFQALPVVVLASFPLVQLAYLVPWFAVEREVQPAWLQDTAWYLVLAWFVAVLVRSAYVAMSPGRWRLARALMAGVLLATPAVVPQGVLPDDSWWSDAAAPGFEDATNPASEAIIAYQRDLQDEALDGLETHTEGSVDLYFIAFAPDGADPDAGTGVDAALEALGMQWRTEGRALVYLNDYTTLTQTPMATVSHLREALAGIAAVSDSSEDIVMVYLSGRTNADGSLRVSLPPLGLMQLSGPGLAYFFNDAELKWRVVVLDTCGATAFAKAIADPDTVVLAAGACNAQSDAGVFGEVVFAAFASATSISGALQLASRNLSAKGMVPYLHVGERIASQLEHVRGNDGGRAATPAPRKGDFAFHRS